jgi:predicted esterase
MRHLLIVLALASAVAAAEPERGRLIEHVASRSDAAQTYTLYLPSSYDAAKSHPLLFVFDPRGRATRAAEIFRDGAERHGWIVISSNQTRSDDGNEANERAIAALFKELPRYAVDRRRIYAAGFSGTAIVACAVGQNTGALAGVIGVGGRAIPQMPPSKFSFAHFGAAGRVDFNNREMRSIDDELAAAGLAHRFVEFDGDHRWFEPALALEAIRWMELVAMKEQRRARDDAFIATALRDELAAAARLEAAGDLVGARRLLRSTARTFEGIHPLRDVESALRRIESDDRSKRAESEVKKWDEFEKRYAREVLSRLPQTMRELAARPQSVAVARAFRVADLQRRAAGSGPESLAAKRLLETVSAQTSFYLPRELSARREYGLAAAVLRVATDLHPERWPVWYDLGAASARAGKREDALDALETAVERGFRDAAHLSADDDYASVRGEKRFQEIVLQLQNWPPVRN